MKKVKKLLFSSISFNLLSSNVETEGRSLAEPRLSKVCILGDDNSSVLEVEEVPLYCCREENFSPLNSELVNFGGLVGDFPLN